MKNTITKASKGLSIKELEERAELTVAFGGDALDADKVRCNGNTVDVPVEEIIDAI